MFQEKEKHRFHFQQLQMSIYRNPNSHKQIFLWIHDSLPKFAMYSAMHLRLIPEHSNAFQQLHKRLLEEDVEHFAADETCRAAQLNSSIFH